jgi:GntR family transcriptional regulator/MocR family aminotransferase
MQLLANLLPPWDDRLITSAARHHGVDVQPVSMNYRYQTPEHGLLLGFAALDEKNMHAAIAGLQATFRDLEAGAPKSGSSK